MMGRPPGSKNARITMPMVARMRELRGIGLSVEAISRLIDLDYGQAPCHSTVRRHTKRRGTNVGTAGLR